MSGSVNKVLLIGNVGTEPEVKYLTSGKPAANFTLATSERWRDKSSGEQKERTEWHRIAVFNEGLCGIIEKYVHKGDKLFLEGQVQTRSWEDQSGAKRFSTEIVLQGFNCSLQLLGSRGGDAPPEPQSTPDLDDSIPF